MFRSHSLMRAGARNVCGTTSLTKAVAAENAFDVAVAVFEKIVVDVLWSIGLAVGEKGHIATRQFT